MEQIREKFSQYIPDYILDEIEYYFNKTLNGKIDIFTLDNIISLINLAVLNHRIDKQKAEELKEEIRNLKNT